MLADLRSPDLTLASLAMAKLKDEASDVDIPRFIALLEDESFVLREAAAWPLSDLGVVSALPALLRAHQRGSDEGHDNDGLSAALIDLVEGNPTEARLVLRDLLATSDDDIKERAEWLLEFCRGDDA